MGSPTQQSPGAWPRPSLVQDRLRAPSPVREARQWMIRTVVQYRTLGTQGTDGCPERAQKAS